MAVFERDELDGDEDTYPLPETAVDRVTADAIFVHESPAGHEGTK